MGDMMERPTLKLPWAGEINGVNGVPHPYLTKPSDTMGCYGLFGETWTVSLYETAPHYQNCFGPCTWIKRYWSDRTYQKDVRKASHVLFPEHWSTIVSSRPVGDGSKASSAWGSPALLFVTWAALNSCWVWGKTWGFSWFSCVLLRGHGFRLFLTVILQIS